MSRYTRTRPFPADLLPRAADLLPRYARSVCAVWIDDDTCAFTAHESEIRHARRAVRIARAEHDHRAALAKNPPGSPCAESAT